MIATTNGSGGPNGGVSPAALFLFQMKKFIRNRPVMRAATVLTPRECEVLKNIGQGKTSKQIASALNLSVYTVGNHRKHICKKLGIHSTAQLVAFAANQSIP